jgi:aminopeptidase YwaD
VRWLANEIGSRPAGSEAEQRAANALAAKLQALGYTVQLQSFSVSRFEDRGSTLEVSAATPSTPSVAAIVNSASGTAQGPLVSVELGRTEDLAGRDVRGAIALIARGEITFAEKVRNVAEAGAIGALIYNQEPGSFQGTMADPAAIPAVALSGTEGAQIVQLLQTQQLTATLTVDAGRVDSVSQNVVATLPGSRDERLVLGAHYDSVAEGPGANDNASGTATVLELARVLPTYDLPYTVDVVLFGSEEIGLVGSRHYVESLALEERERIIGMLNFDMVGVGEEPMVGGTAELVAMVTDAAAQAGVELGLLGDGLNGRSDHASFLNAGIPALFFYRSDDPNYHTANDQATYVDGAHLEFAGRLALAVLTSVEELAPAAP